MRLMRFALLLLVVICSVSLLCVGGKYLFSLCLNIFFIVHNIYTARGLLVVQFLLIHLI